MALFDTHLHIIDPAHPLVENNGYLRDALVALNQGGRRFVGVTQIPVSTTDEEILDLDADST